MEQNKQITTAEAVQQLSKALKEDESYWDTWGANIAISMYDEMQFNFLNDELQVAMCAMTRTEALERFNKGADRFLKLLTAEKSTDNG